MFLIVHVGVALASVSYTAYVFFSPSGTKLAVAYFLIAMTLISGISLVLLNPSHLSQACIAGIVYLAVSFSGIALIRTKIRRLAIG